MVSLPCCDFFRTDYKAGALPRFEKCTIGCLVHEVRRATNLYHGICINGREEWYFCKQASSNYGVGDYCKTPDGDGEFVKCTYDADIVIVPNRYNNTNQRNVVLPRASDFGGKIIEVIDNAYTNGQSIGNIVVSAADGGYFSAPVFRSGVTQIGGLGLQPDGIQ